MKGSVGRAGAFVEDGSSVGCQMAKPGGQGVGMTLGA